MRSVAIYEIVDAFGISTRNFSVRLLPLPPLPSSPALLAEGEGGLHTMTYSVEVRRFSLDACK